MIKMHLMMCKYCVRFSRQLKTLRDACRLEDLHGEDCDPTQALPQATQDRLKQSLSSKIAAQK
jgi:hypothetical protein